MSEMRLDAVRCIRAKIMSRCDDIQWCLLFLGQLEILLLWACRLLTSSVENIWSMTLKMTRSHLRCHNGAVFFVLLRNLQSWYANLIICVTAIIIIIPFFFFNPTKICILTGVCRLYIFVSTICVCLCACVYEGRTFGDGMANGSVSPRMAAMMLLWYLGQMMMA